jgi:hypothetical protein
VVVPPVSYALLYRDGTQGGQASESRSAKGRQYCQRGSADLPRLAEFGAALSGPLGFALGHDRLV